MFCCAFALKVREQEKEFAHQMRNNMPEERRGKKDIGTTYKSIFNQSHYHLLLYATVAQLCIKFRIEMVSFKIV